MADDDKIPLRVRELIRERIHAIEALEVIVLLRERRPEAPSVAELSRVLRLGEDSVEQAVDELAAAGLIQRESGVRYAPETLELDQDVAALVDTYRTLRVETLVFISNSALGRVRDNALRTFAEAFRLRGKK